MSSGELGQGVAELLREDAIDLSLRVEARERRRAQGLRPEPRDERERATLRFLGGRFGIAVGSAGVDSR